MRKITFLLALLTLIVSTNSMATTPGVKTSTAWFNGETFETFTAPYDLTAAIANPTAGYQYSGWTATGCFVGIQNGVASTTGTAAGNVLGFPAIAAYDATAIAFSNYPTGSTSGAKTASKTFTTLSGYIYIKTSFYANTYATSYILRNSSSQDVFAFSTAQATSNAFSTTGVTAATWAIGARANWGNIEAVLDLNGGNKVARKITYTYNGVSKSQSDIALTNGTDISVLAGSISRSAGLDNTTIGQLIADNIQDITASQTNHQTGDGTVSSTLGVTAISTVMGLALPFSGANTDVDITWTISDWGAITNQADKDKISIVRGAADYTSAILSTTGTISTDADITITAAVTAGATLTKVISIKSLSIEGVKSTLLSEITDATTVKNAVTDANPYLNDLKSTLNAVIVAGQSTYDNAGATIPDITTATSNLVSAKSAFATGIAPYNTYSGYINSVKAGRDTVGTNYPSVAFFTAIKSTLNTAVSIAEAAKDTISSTAAITNADNALVTAYGIFNTDRPSLYTLGAQIKTTTTRYNAVLPRQGEAKFLQFPTVNIDALSGAITSANSSLNTGTSASEINNTTTDLATALSTFNSAARVAPSTNYYRIFTYGAGGGDGTEVKKMLYTHKTDSLVWTSIANSKTLAIGDSALWLVTVGSANNKYIIQNKATGLYLNGIAFSATTVENSINEVKSQNGYITGFIDWSTRVYADPNFIYSINNGTTSLEVQGMINSQPYGFFRNGGAADRYRFAFQFEEQLAPSVSTVEGNIKTFACNANTTDNATLTLTGDNLFGANINLSITGTDASVFSVSAATISPINTYLRNNAVTVTYSPVTGQSHTAKLLAAVDGGNTLEYDLTGSILTSVVGSPNANNMIYVSNDKINFEAKAGELVEVYNTLGMKIAERNSVDGLNSISVPAKGLLIVKVGNRTAKVVL